MHSSTFSEPSRSIGSRAVSIAAAEPALFSEHQVGACTFLTGPLTGGLMFAWNAVQLSQFSRAAAAVVGAATLTACLFLLALLVPGHIVMLISLGLAYPFKQLTWNSFEYEIDQRRELDRGWAPNWLAAGISIASLSMLIAVALMAA